MNPREAGFLLLTSHMGDPARKVLTVPQLRVLAQSVGSSSLPHGDGEVTAEELMKLGFNRPSAQRILDLLSEEERLNWYLEKAKLAGCTPVTRVSTGYPLILRKRLGLNSPGCLWFQGDPDVLDRPMVALVGSRELRRENREFAEQVGVQAARQGFALVSGNAKGADCVAQEACLAAGGKVVSVVADRLDRLPERENVLYISEDGYDLPFSPQRALSRNRVIHCLGRVVIVAQCALGEGGTWDGTVYNLKQNLSPVFCFADGSEASLELGQRGAVLTNADALRDLESLLSASTGFIDNI